MTATTTALADVRLSRAAAGVPTPPERIVHLGLGAFHRAHQAWYTAHAADADEWGIAAFTGRSRDLVDRLGPQDGLYTLVERAADGDRFELIPSIVRVEAGDDVPGSSRPSPTLRSRSSRSRSPRPATGSPPTVLRTSRMRPWHPMSNYFGTRSRATPLATRQTPSGPRPRSAGYCWPSTPGVAPTRARSRSCPATTCPTTAGSWDARWPTSPAGHRPTSPRGWRASVSVVSTSIDRITPAIDAEAESHAVLGATGWLDAAPVVTEPFSDWVLEGDFPAGRPDWESAGARFVDEIAPWENRKLWMLNGAHTVLATFGQTRGHTVVSAAIEDPVCSDLVEALWDDDARQLPGFDLADYRAALLERFRNPRIEHRLAQIAQDSTTKMRLRIVPVALGQLASGHEAPGCAAAIAAWMLGVRAGWASVPDGIDQPAIADLDASARHTLLAALNARLADDAGFAAHVADAVTALETS